MRELKRIINIKFLYACIISMALCIACFFVSDDVYDAKKYDNYIETYNTNVEKILKNAQKLKQFSTFTSNSYVVRNIDKTYNDYIRLLDVSPVVMNTEGFDRYVEYIPVISGFVFFILLYCLFNMQREYDNGEIIFTHSYKNGRIKHAIKRNCIYTLLGIVLTFIFNLFVLLLSGISYGFPEFLVPVQSSVLFADCTIPLSVLAFCVINAFLIGSSLAFVTLLGNALLNFLRNKYISVGLLGGIFLIEWRLSLLPMNNSWNRFLGSVNIYRLFDFSTYFRNYQNVNILGNPVSSLLLIIVVTLILYVIAFVSSTVAYAHRYPFSQILFGSISNIVEKIKSGICSRLSFTGLELFKIFFRKKKIFFVILLAVLEVFLINATIVRFPERQKQMDQVYALYGGEDWGKFDAYLDKFRNEINNKENELEILEDKYQGDEQMLGKISRLTAEIGEMTKMIEEYDSVVNRRQFIKEQTGISVYMMSDRGYNEVIGNNSLFREAGIMMLLSLLVGILGAGYFLEEKQSGVCKLFSCSKSGIRKIYIKKLQIIIGTVIVLIALFIAVDFIILNNIYGFKFLEAPILSLSFMGTKINTLWVGLTIWQYLFINTLIKVLILLIELGIMLVMSVKAKSVFFMPIVVFLTALVGCMYIIS